MKKRFSKKQDEALRRGRIVRGIASDINWLPKNLDDFADRIAMVCDDKLWESWELEGYKEIVEWKDFESFVTGKNPRGWGTTLDSLRYLIRDFPKALIAFDKATQRGPGNPSGSNQHLGTVDIVNSSSRPDGNSAPRAIRALRAHGHDKLLSQIESGDLTPNKAAIMAGLRKRKVQVVPSDSEQIIRTLKRHCDDATIERIKSGL